MTKYHPSNASHIPFSLSLLSLSCANHQPQRPANEQLISTQRQLQLTNLSDDEDILQENINESRRIKNRKINKSALIAQNQNLKKQNTILNEKYEDCKQALSSITLVLKEKEVDLKHYQGSNNDLSQNIKLIEKRKSILELQLSKLHNQLQASKEDIDRFERQINHLLGVHKSKDQQLIQLMHRHSQQVKQLKANHKEVIQQYEDKQQQTKKLLKRLNGISQQKQSKIRQELEQFKASYEKVSEISSEQVKSIQRLEQQNRNLKQMLKNSQNRYQADLINLKAQSQRISKESLTSKQLQFRRITEDLRRQIEQKEVQIKTLDGTLKTEEARWRGAIASKQKQIKVLTDQARGNEKQFERVTRQNEKQINRVTSLNLKNQQIIEELEISNQELSSKNEALQTSMKQLYRQTSELESKLLEISKQRTSLSSQNNNLKQQLRVSKEQLMEVQNALSNKQMQLSKNQSQLNKVSATLQKLTNQLVYFDKANKSLQDQNQQLLQNQAQHKNANVQLRQMVLQKQINFQTLRQKYTKLQQFIENYKVEAERTRETTEKKWFELRVVYQKQLEQLEDKIKEREKSYNQLKLKLEVAERDNKIYEFENTVLPSMGMSTSIYHRM